MQNYKELFSRIASWLNPGGLLFFHIFVHCRGLPYHYEVRLRSWALVMMWWWLYCRCRCCHRRCRRLRFQRRGCHTGGCRLPSLLVPDFDAISMGLQVQGEDDWMTKFFFAGGTMVSEATGCTWIACAAVSGWFCFWRSWGTITRQGCTMCTPRGLAVSLKHLATRQLPSRAGQAPPATNGTNRCLDRLPGMPVAASYQLTCCYKQHASVVNNCSPHSIA